MKIRFPMGTLLLLAATASPLLAQAPADAGQVMTETAVEERPVAVPGSCRAPVYPASLRAAMVEGRVLLQVVIDTAGRIEPQTIRTVNSTHSYFDEAARRALTSCRYRPARLNQQPVRVAVQIPFAFQLRRT